MKKPLQVLGQTFGYWTIIDDVESKNGKRHVIAECECGVRRITRIDNITSGKSTNCGCKRREDMVGKKYGMLTIIKFLGMERRDQKLECICECGKTTTTTSDNLRRGITKSCGCLTSWGNQLIERLLSSNGFDYQCEFKDSRCRKTKPLPFDFAVTIDESIRLIEYQGKQHYVSDPKWGGTKKFKQVQESDQIKRLFCRENDIPLLVIPYWEQTIMDQKILEFLKTPLFYF